MIEVKDNTLYRDRARDFLIFNPAASNPTGDVLDTFNRSERLKQIGIDEYAYIESDSDDYGASDAVQGIWSQFNVRRHEVKLNSMLQEYSDTEGRYIPELQKAREYLTNKEQIRSLQQQLFDNNYNWSDSQKQAANAEIERLKVRNEQLEYGADNSDDIGLRTLARTNPYLRDIFYNTSYYDSIDDRSQQNALNQPGSREAFTIKDRLKIRLYDWISGTYTSDFDHSNNLSHYISEGGVNTPFGKVGGPTQEQLDYLWNLRNTDNQLDKQLSELDDAIKVAEAREYDKRSDIAARINTIKKGDWMFDPTAVHPEFTRKYQKYRDEGVSLSNVESWLYTLPELGSSYSEIQAMIASMSVSAMMNMAAKGAITYTTGGLAAPLLFAATEAGINYGIQSYMRGAETKSEMFDASAARALQMINENNIPLNSIVEQYKPVLKEKGYPVESMTDQEIFNLSLIEPEQLQAQPGSGITPEKAEMFEYIKQTSLDDAHQAVIRQTNQALSVPDFVVNTMIYSYGGKFLKNMYGMRNLNRGVSTTSEVAQTSYQRAMNTVYDAVPKTGKIAQLQSYGNKIIDKAIIKNFDKIVKNPMTRVSTNRVLKGMAAAGKAMGISYFNERNEEGIQNIVSARYQKGLYDNVQNYSILDGLANAGVLGVEANLAYFGLHPDESLNTSKDLRNSMDVGGFTGLFMSGIGNTVNSVNLYRQVLTDQKLRGLVADRYGDAERDNKVEAFVKAGNENGNNFLRIRESLQSLKQHKPEGVTDQMIDEDIDLANRVSFWLQNKSFRDIADRIGAKKGSKERTYILQNLIDLQDRTNEQGKVTNQVAEQLDNLVQEILTGANKDFDFALGREYGNYVKRKRTSAKKEKEIRSLSTRVAELQKLIADTEAKYTDWNEADKASKKYRDELAQVQSRQAEIASEIQSDPITYQQYRKNTVDQIIQVRAYKLLKQLKQEIESRKNDLQKLAREKHLDVNLEGISGIGEYVDQFLRQSKPFIDRLVQDARANNADLTEDQFLELALDRYSNLPKQEEFDNLIVSRAVNAGAYNDLLNHLAAYTTGYYTGDMRLYNRTFENLTAEEQAEIEITPQQYNERYAESEAQNEMEEQADQISTYRTRAERVVERDLTRRQAKVKQARQEILEENGTPLNQPVVEPREDQPNENIADVMSQADTGHTNGQEDSSTSQVNVDTSATIQGVDEEQKSKLEASIEELESTLGQREEVPQDNLLDEESVQDYEPIVPVEQVREEVGNNIADSDPEQDTIRLREERVEVEDNTKASVQETAQEETNTVSSENEIATERTNEQSPQQEPTEVTKVETPSTSNKSVIPPTEDVVNPLAEIPTNDELFIDPATDQLMHDPTGMHDVTNATIVDASSLQTQNEFEQATDEWIVGPSMYQKQTANADAINPTETSAKQKRRYIASTFFYPPTSSEVMPIQNYGIQIEFVTKDGKKAERRPGKELAELLSIPGWVNEIDDAYYIVTSSMHHFDANEIIDNLAVHLIIEKDGKVYNASLRAITPELRKELLSTGMTEQEVSDQINKLRTFRNQIIKQYYPQGLEGKQLPNEALKHVKPVNLRSSNGSLNNTVTSQGLPEFRLLSDVDSFAVSTDPQEITEQLQNPDAENGVEIGYGAGPFATNLEPFSIQRLDQQGQTSVQGRGYAGKLYLIPKTENTPSQRSTLPIMLAEELHRISGVNNYSEIELSINADGTVNKGVIPSTAELIFNLMTGIYSWIPAEVQSFLLNVLANTGPKTSTAGFDREESNKYNFLVRKQLLTFESRDANGNVIRKGLVTAESRQQGLPQYGYKPHISNLLKLTNDEKKKAIWNIAQNIHWNTDKDLLMSEFPQEFVNMLINTFNNYKGKKDENTQFPIFTKQLSFSLRDIGYMVKDGKVVKKEGVSPILASWYITHGKIKTDIGKRAFYAPFVYSDGARVSQAQKELQSAAETTKTVTSQGKPVETKRPVSEVEQPTKPTGKRPTIALAATPENLQKYNLSIPSNMKAPVGQAWGIVQDKQGNYKVVLAPKNRVQGFTSIERGEGDFDKVSALKWLEDTLGINVDNTDILVVNGIASTLSDSRVYGVMRVVADTLSGQLMPQFLFSNDAGKGIEYHEAFHYVTQLLLNKRERAALYAEYERRNPGDSPRTKREVEELLAEEFRGFMLNETNPTVSYRIKKFFRNVVNYIKALFGKTNIQDTLFNQIAKGKFKNYKPDSDTLKEFYDAYGEGLYYYVPGLTREQVDRMPNITDGNTFYKVVDSLTSTVLTMYKIRSLRDVENLSIQGIFDQIQDRLDQGWIDEQNELLVQDVLNNKDVFKKYILRKLRSLSIRESDTLESEEQSRLETETGDNPDNNWDKNQGDHSKKKNIAFKAKLFFYSVPTYKWSFVEHEDGSITKEAEPVFDDIFGFNIAESFNIVWNKIMNNLWDIDSYQDILNEVARLANTDTTFYALNQILNDLENPIDDNTKTQLETTIKSYQAEFNTVKITHGNPGIQGAMSDEEYQDQVNRALEESNWEIQNSRSLRRVALYPRQWSNAFFASSSVLSDSQGNRYINRDLLSYLNPIRAAINKSINPFINPKYKGKKPDNIELLFQQIKDDFVKICNAISIPFDTASLDKLLDESPDPKLHSGNVELDKFIDFWSSNVSRSKSFTNILENLVSMSNKANSTIKSRGSSYIRTADRLFTYSNYDAAINRMARAYGAVHPSQQEFTVTGADGALVYAISENNYTNDQFRNINQNKNGKLDQILNTPYSKRSLIANAARNGTKFKLNSFLMLKTENDPGRDYFGISPIEDYITKLVLTFNNEMTLPTMSDKKTWYSVSGLTLIKDVLKSSRRRTITSFDDVNQSTDVETVNRRFSDSTLKTFANMFLDEFDAVWDYYLHKDYVAKHPKERIDNYHGKIVNGVMQAGGNGGRFRYFSSIQYNGTIQNINHVLAKMETEDTTEAVLQYLKNLKMLLFKNDDFRDISEVDADSNIFDAMNNFLLDATRRELEAITLRGIVNLTNGKYSNNLIPDNIFRHYDKLLGDNDYDKSQKAQRQEDMIYSIIGSHVANTMISIIEFEKCVTGDPAYYKHKTKKVEEESDIDGGSTVQFMIDTGRDVDKIKRLSAVLSTGTNLRTVWDTAKESNRDVSVLTLKDNNIGSNYEEQLRSIFRNSLLRDIYSRKHPKLSDDEIIKILADQDTENDFYNSLTKEEKEYVDHNTEASVSPYTYGKDKNGKTDYSEEGSINQSDAAVYIRPTMYKRIMKALGNWSQEIEEAYNIMEGEDESWMSDPVLYSKTTAALAQPLKMVYFGDHFRKATNLNVPIFDKMAMFPLFKALAKGDNRLIYDRMNNEELGVIDMIAFESAVKVGGTPKFQAYKDANNETFNVQDLNKPSYNKTRNEDSLPVYTQDISNLRLQLNTEPHDAIDRAFGTQAIKICLANLVDDRTYGINKGKAIKGRQLKQEVMQAINDLTEHGRLEILKRFFKGRNIKNKALSEYLISQAVDSNMPESFIEGLGLDKDGEFIVPLEATSNRRWVESRLISYVNKTVVDLNTKGGAAIQMSSFGFKTTGARKQKDGEFNLFNNGEELKFLREDGSMEVMLSTNFFRHIVPKVNQGSYGQMRQWLLEHNIIGPNAKPIGVGYRIPTQGLSSTFSFVVKDVIPDRFGDTVVVPNEFTAMTGSDFDVDKLYIAMLNTDKNGNIIQYDSEKSPHNQSVEAWQNKVIQTYQTVISDSSNMSETRASIDTLTKILQNEILPKVQPGSKTEAQPAYELLPSFQLARKEEYTSGKAGIGPFALNSTNHSLTQFVHLNMHYSNSNPYQLGQLDEIKGRDGYRILDWLSAMINAHVDVAKDPYVITLNVNSVTYNMTNLLLRGGMGKNTFYFLAQPVLKSFANTILANNGIYGAKQVDPSGLLRQYRRQYARQLRSLIDTMEDGSRKDLWKHKFNDIIRGYSIDGISEYPIVDDPNFSSTKYSDTFDENKLSYALTNKGTIDSIYQQLLVINAYQILSEDAQRLSDLVNRSQIDTKKYGNTIATQMNFNNSYATFKYREAENFYIRGEEQSESSALETYFNTTFLAKKLYWGTELPRQVLGGQVFSSTSAFQDIFTAVMGSLFGRVDIKDSHGVDKIAYKHQSDKKKVNTMATYVSSIIRSRLTKNIPQLYASDQELRDFFYGSNTMARKWAGLKSYIREHKDEFPDLINQDGTFSNMLLDYLQEYPADGVLTFADRIIPVESTMNNDADIDNRLTTAFAELLYHKDEVIRAYAEDLAKYAYVTSYDERGRNTFFNLVPNQWKQEVGYISAIKQALIEFRGQNNQMAYQMIAENTDDYNSLYFPSISTSIARNMWDDDSVVPTLIFKEKRYNEYERRSEGSERTIAYGKKKIGNRIIRIPDAFTTPEFSSRNQDFVKVTFNFGNVRTTELYQRIGRVGYIKEDDKLTQVQSVYKRIPKLGFTDNGMRVMELQKESTDVSAFEANAFEETSIWDNDRLAELALNSIKDLSVKYGLQKTYIPIESPSIGVKSSSAVSGLNDQNQDGLDVSVQNDEMSIMNTQNTMTDEQLASIEAEISGFVNVSIDEGVRELVQDMNDVLDVMNSIDITQSQVVSSVQESVDAMDMSEFTAEQPVKRTKQNTQQQTNTTEMNFADFQSIEAIDMNELVALGQNRRKQCK